MGKSPEYKPETQWLDEVAEALKLSPEQRKQFNQLRKDISDLTRQLRNR